MRGSLWSFIRLGIGALTSKDGQGDKLVGTPGSGGSPNGQETAARFYPWGFDSRSPTGGKRLCVAPGGGSNLVQVGERNDNAKPDYDDSEWTTILHNEVAGTWVKLRGDGGIQIGGQGSLVELKSNGAIKLTAKDGAKLELKGDTLYLNGGTTKIIRANDPVDVGEAMATWMAAVTSKTMVAPLVGTVIGVSTGGNPKVLG